MAPIALGQPQATLWIMSGDQLVADIPLIALEAAEQAGLVGRAWDSMRLWIR